MEQTVSIQGFEGSFHQIAAQRFFGEAVQIMPCATFREVLHTTAEGKTFASVMAIENSIAGSILPNYTLLQKSGLKVCGEVYLPIEQHLLVNKGVQLDEIKEVHSHPMAIQQCLDYLVPKGWKLVETEDTALSAKRLMQHKNKHAAAIAGSLAARLFDLDILAPNIHTEKHNYTRFLILQKSPTTISGADKASISFQTHHQRGSLASVLTKIAEAGINLSKLQSFPIPSRHWRYYFHADLEFDSVEQLHNVLKDLKKVTQQIVVYGVYKNGNKS